MDLDSGSDIEIVPTQKPNKHPSQSPLSSSTSLTSSPSTRSLNSVVPIAQPSQQPPTRPSNDSNSNSPREVTKSKHLNVAEISSDSDDDDDHLSNKNRSKRLKSSEISESGHSQSFAGLTAAKNPTQLEIILTSSEAPNNNDVLNISSSPKAGLHQFQQSEESNSSLPNLEDIFPQVFSQINRTISAPTCSKSTRQNVINPRRVDSVPTSTRTSKDKKNSTDKGKGRMVENPTTPDSSVARDEEKDAADILDSPTRIFSSPRYPISPFRSPIATAPQTRAPSKNSIATASKNRGATAISSEDFENDENEDRFDSAKRRSLSQPPKIQNPCLIIPSQTLRSPSTIVSAKSQTIAASKKKSSNSFSQPAAIHSKKEDQRLTKEAKEALKSAKLKAKEDARRKREANKLTLNRKETVTEVYLRIPKSIKPLKDHPLNRAQKILEQRIKTRGDCNMNMPIEYDDKTFDDEGDDENEGDWNLKRGIVNWIRRSDREFDEESKTFLPLSFKKESIENSRLIVFDENEIERLLELDSKSFSGKILKIKSLFKPDDQLFIIIKAISNGDERGKSSKSSKLKKEKIIKELEMIKIMNKNVFMIKVERDEEIADWLFEMTLEIGVRPYKALRQDLRSDLRLEISGSKGSDHEDTYIKFLSSLNRITESEAKGIIYKFPTLRKLYLSWKKFEDLGDLKGAENMLVGCCSSNGKNGKRSIGNVTSKRIYEVMFKALDGSICANK